jgi:hypothetical protein
MNREAPYKTRPFSPLFTKQGSRTASAVTRATEGPGEPQAVTMPRKKSKPSKEIVRKGKQEESFDLYDLILSHLLDEGYAETQEAAEAIMVNMSEDWRESIVEQNATDSMADRARLAVGHQRAGTLGDADLKNKIKQATAPRPKPTSTPNTAASWVGGV